MNRHYDTAFYRDLVTRIRKTFEGASITTDIMVGFAGENEKDFADSVAFLSDIGFAKTHVFAYSRREGTAAYSYNEQVDKKTKAQRSKIMIEAAAKCESDFLKQQIGTIQEVLFETEENGYSYGYTKNYSRVKFKNNSSLQNQIIKVKITDIDGETLIAE